MNNTITHPIGSARGNAATLSRDSRLLKRIWQNLWHESDKNKIELARQRNRAKVLNLHS